MIAATVRFQCWIHTRAEKIEERGATAVEYALMVGLIAVGIIIAVSALSNKTAKTFNRVTGTLPS
jgi:pilus assembly protein Flp/PilA